MFHSSYTHRRTYLITLFACLDRRFSSFQRQLNLYGFRKNLSAGVNGSYFHPFFQRGRTDLLKQIFRLNATSSSFLAVKGSSLPSPEDTGFLADHLPVNQEDLKSSRVSKEVKSSNIVNPSLQVGSSKQQSVKDKDEEWQFPSAAMEDYWQIMDERVMTFFNHESSQINNTDHINHINLPVLHSPLKVISHFDHPSSISRIKSNEVSASTIPSASISVPNKESSNSNSSSSSTSMPMPRTESAYPGSPMTVRLHGKREAPALRKVSTTNAKNAPPKKRVRFDSARSMTVSGAELKVQPPIPTTFYSQLYHEDQPWVVRNKCFLKTSVPRSPRHFGLQLPRQVEEAQFTHFAASTRPSDQQERQERQERESQSCNDARWADESPATCATASTDSESSRSDSLGHFEGTDIEGTGALCYTSRDGISMVGQRSVHGSMSARSDNNCGDAGEGRDTFSLAHYFTSY